MEHGGSDNFQGDMRCVGFDICCHSVPSDDHFTTRYAWYEYNKS